MPHFDFSDLWHEARMTEVIQYLAGSHFLQIPDDWRGYFPETPRV